MLNEVMTEYGLVRGIEAADPRITAFKGIPFAAPPVGENRWRAPQPCEPWEGVLDCVRFAPISMQSPRGVDRNVYQREWNCQPEIPMGEDCLYLNVWTPAKKAGEKLPVLVWFFGGGLQEGYTAEMEFDGERLARRGIVVVTVNYRLGAFGFMCHPEITAAQPDAPANYGHLDQQAGIKWTIKNIDAFGGDPEKITISGQSAGGGSTMTQIASIQNHGLFQRAVVMSGMIRNPYAGYVTGGPGRATTLEGAEKLGERFLELLGVKTIEEARKLDAFYIRDKYMEFAKDRPLAMGTVQDGVFLTGDPVDLFRANKCVKVQIMSGNTKDEFPNLLKANTAEEAQDIAEEIFGAKAGDFLKYADVPAVKETGIFGKMNGIEWTVKQSFMENNANGGEGRHYYYRFNVDIPGWDNAGKFHSVDLWFWFETLAKCWRPFNGKHYDIARLMCNYYVNFIKTGDPNGEDADGTPMPLWKAYTAEGREEIEFTTEGALVGPEKRDTLEVQMLKLK